MDFADVLFWSWASWAENGHDQKPCWCKLGEFFLNIVGGDVSQKGWGYIIEVFIFFKKNMCLSYAKQRMEHVEETVISHPA